jgi:hypothetical protein
MTHHQPTQPTDSDPFKAHCAWIRELRTQYNGLIRAAEEAEEDAVPTGQIKELCSDKSGSSASARDAVEQTWLASCPPLVCRQRARSSSA